MSPFASFASPVPNEEQPPPDRKRADKTRTPTQRHAQDYLVRAARATASRSELTSAFVHLDVSHDRHGYRRRCRRRSTSSSGQHAPRGSAVASALVHTGRRGRRRAVASRRTRAGERRAATAIDHHLARPCARFFPRSRRSDLTQARSTSPRAHGLDECAQISPRLVRQTARFCARRRRRDAVGHERHLRTCQQDGVEN